MKNGSLVIKLCVAFIGALLCYYLTVTALDFLTDNLPKSHPLRPFVGLLWAASQPFMFGIFVFALEALGCFWVAGIFMQRIKRAPS
jgi:hypothetical protein